MRWQISLRPEAIADLDDAAAWYEARSAGLGRDFVQEISAAISRLTLAPLIPRLRHRSAGIRWVRSKRFPYRVIYRVEAERIVIFAIMHSARSDSAWRERK